MNFLHPIVFSTTGTISLGKRVCSELEKRLPKRFLPKKGIIEGKMVIDKFSNENLQIAVQNIRDHFVVILHTQASPVNEGLMELFTLLDAVVRAKPAQILIFFPYMPYVRSDRKNKARISVMGHRLAKIISSYGINCGLPIKTLLLDPHDSHIKHYFEPDCEEITAMFLLAFGIKNNFNLENTIIVFPDNGAAKKFEDVAHFLGLDVAYIDKRRDNNKEKPDIRKIVGEVKNKTCILIDDEILTGGTVFLDADALYKEGAKEVAVAALHPIFMKNNKSNTFVIENIENSAITKAIVSNTVPIKKRLNEVKAKKFIVVDSSPLIAEAIKRVICSQSLSELYEAKKFKLYC
jgi:ribose-phosphate pyrophosphokinase